MALGTITVDGKHSINNLEQVKEFELTLLPEDSYPTGGTLLFSELVRDALIALPYQANNSMQIIDVTAVEAAGYKTEYLKGTDALAVYVSGGTEVANTTDLSGGGVWRLLVKGV